MTVSRSVIVALLAVIALASFGLAWVVFDLGRNGDMRDAEADFQARLRAGRIAAPAPAEQAAASPTERTAASEDEDLAAWYAASDEPGAGSGGAPD